MSGDAGLLAFSKSVALRSAVIQILAAFGLLAFIIYVLISCVANPEEVRSGMGGWPVVAFLGCFVTLFECTLIAGGMEHLLVYRYSALRLKEPDADLTELQRRIRNYHIISITAFLLIVLMMGGVAVYSFYVAK